ncbi:MULTISPECIES: hypothetical protein [unclassified Streptomyces]|uniref:hypothetical protein n=1 Tax=unclassified Streptomyces TaxID=2593676 RepID=UPI00093C1B3D|nr:hypothetical protein [Streptomyces sp. TSRI0107]OKJ88389.1 hypothetical protein AMK31_07710 [Streptomyces sp. TSRI0107]
MVVGVLADGEADADTGGSEDDYTRRVRAHFAAIGDLLERAGALGLPEDLDPHSEEVFEATDAEEPVTRSPDVR